MAYLCNCDDSELNCHSSVANETCTSVTWNYNMGESCMPVSYTLQGFYLEDVRSGNLDHPRVEFQAMSPTFAFPTSSFQQESILLRAFAANPGGGICEMSNFYNFTTILEYGA